jgi:hypothetical protein
MQSSNLILINIDETRDPEKWFQKSMNYDVAFIQYKYNPIFKDRLKELTDNVWSFSHINKGKWRNIKNLLVNPACSYLEGYDLFWFPDPDLECLFKISDLFDFVRRHGFGVSQPSLTKDSQNSHSESKHIEHSLYRRGFTEIMCPMFSRNALVKHMWTFGLTYSGYGIDLLWSNSDETVIIDRFQVRHAEKPHFEQAAYLNGWPNPTWELKQVRSEFLEAR